MPRGQNGSHKWLKQRIMSLSTLIRSRRSCSVARSMSASSGRSKGPLLWKSCRSTQTPFGVPCCYTSSYSDTLRSAVSYQCQGSSKMSKPYQPLCRFRSTTLDGWFFPSTQSLESSLKRFPLPLQTCPLLVAFNLSPPSLPA